jgi:glycosyltransferase involved in cell wall biosynthesis
MEKISLVMIVKNEEKNLEKSIKSIEKYVDEIVIIDTGSTDKTKEIAEKNGAKVIDYKWNDDFASVRNFAHDYVSNSWIIYMDADWVFEGIGVFDNLDFANNNAFEIDWVNEWVSGEILSEQQKIVLYNKNFYKWNGVVHEYLKYTGKNKQTISYLNGKIWHFKNTNKNTNYAEILENILNIESDSDMKMRYLMFLVQEYAIEKRWDEIVKVVEKIYIKDSVDEYKVSIMEYYTIAFLQTDKTEKKVDFINKNLANIKDSRKWLIMGDLFSVFNSEEAVKSYQKFLSQNNEVINKRNWERYVVYPNIMIGNMLLNIDVDMARKYFTIAMQKTKIIEKKIALEQLLENKK